MQTKNTTVAALAATAAICLAGCSASSGTGNSSSGGGGVEITSALWDPAQLPVYQQCATVFHQETGITVEVTQTTWTNYWTNLLTELAAGTGPDVFTDHVNYFDQLVTAGQLLDMTPYFKQDGFNLGQYDIPSNKLWNVGGKQYALSQDKDVEGLLYNVNDIPAGTTAAQLSSLTWNPSDGGTFQQLIEHLTIDKNGNRGDSPKFDKNDVKTYGFAMETGDGISGQVSWSPFALSTGWTYTNKNPYGTQYYLNDPRLSQTWDWLQKMYADGFIAPAKLVTSLGEQPVLDQNVAATMMQGSWEASSRVPSADKAQKFQWAQLPSGPVGHPVSLSNSIGPSVNAATKHPAQAVKWAEFIASPTCANIVARAGVEIPAIPAAAVRSLQTLRADGVDISGWEALFSQPSHLVLWPLTAAGAQINTLANTAFDVTLPSGQQSAQSVLNTLNSQVNALLK